MEIDPTRKLLPKPSRLDTKNPKKRADFVHLELKTETGAEFPSFFYIDQEFKDIPARRSLTKVYAAIVCSHWIEC